MLCAVIGSLEHPISSLSVDGPLTADGGSSKGTTSNPYDLYNLNGVVYGGGSVGTIILFVNILSVGESGVVSSDGGYGNPNGSGGGGGGRIHFHWSHISTGDVYQTCRYCQREHLDWFVSRIFILAIDFTYLKTP